MTPAPPHVESMEGRLRRQAALTGFMLLFAIVGLALYGLPFFYDFFVRELGWSRTTVASGNAVGKLIAGPLFGFGAVGGTMQHLKLYLSLDHGFGQMQAAGLLSAVLWVSLVGRLLMGWLADRLGAKPAAILIYGLVALGAGLLLALPPGPALYLFALVFGLGLGGEYLIVPVLAAELFGTVRIGRLLGIILTFDGLAEALSPMLIGTLRDSSGNYHSAFVALIVMALVGLVAILALPKRRTAALTGMMEAA